MFEIYVRLETLFKVYEARDRLQPLLHFDSVEASNKIRTKKLKLVFIELNVTNGFWREEEKVEVFCVIFCYDV